MKIIKRNGKEVPFNKEKVLNAITKANEACDCKLNPTYLLAVADDVEEYAMAAPFALSVEDISDYAQRRLMNLGREGQEVAICFVQYRHEHALARSLKENTTDAALLSLINRENEEAKQENSNKNPIINSTLRDYVAGEVSKDLTRRVLLPPEVVKAHDDGIIHFHDADYFVQPMYNCCLINLEDMLQNGTVISETMIEKPHSFYTAANVTTQIVAQVASNQYGGQSFSLAHLAPFVDVSRKRYIKEVQTEFDAEGIAVTERQVQNIAEKRVLDEIKRGIQTIQYQLVTLMTCNGQAPFVTMFMDINEAKDDRTRKDLVLCIQEVLRQRMQGVKNEDGVWITPAFPKLVYVLDENNIYEDSEYYFLTRLAAECTAKRMVPDYISAKKMREYKKGNVYTPMGCRSFLTVEDNIKNPDGSYKLYGRFNQGVVTINLPDIALSSDGDEKRFWEIMDERLELCHKALRARHERLLGTPSDVAPILWQHGAIARLKKGEVIDKLLYDGYSTLSLGYAGLYETVMAMKGVSHTSDEGRGFGLAIMQALNDACTKWREAENIAYSVYGTPLESTTYKFAKCLQRRFGAIEGVTSHNYITNSYHVCVRENIDAFTKLSFESEFQALSPGGAISYVEVPDLKDNIEAVLTVMEHIYDNITYAELNTKSDYCMECGYDGEIQIVEASRKLVWECPHCGNRDESKMSVARRTCGYIGTQFWNQGRTQEIQDRVLHL